MVRALIVGSALLIATVSPLLGQTKPTLRPGVGVRVKLDSESTGRVAGDPVVESTAITGTFIDLSADSIAFQSTHTGRVNTVPIGRLSRLEVQRARTAGEAAFRGFKWGAPIGGALGFLAGLACATEEYWYSCSGAEVALTTFVLAGVGGGIGSVIGLALPGDVWDTVPLEELRLNVKGDGSFAWSVSFDF